MIEGDIVGFVVVLLFVGIEVEVGGLVFFRLMV